MPEWQAVNTRNRSFVIGALVDIPEPGREGVLFAHGHAVRRARAVRQGQPAALREQLRRQRGADGRRRRGHPDRREPDPVGLVREGGQEPIATTGTLSLYHGDKKVGEGKIKTQLGAFAIAGSGLYVGRHAGEPVTDDYPGEPPYAFTGGTIHRVAVDVSGEPYIDLERTPR